MMRGSVGLQCPVFSGMNDSTKKQLVHNETCLCNDVELEVKGKSFRNFSQVAHTLDIASASKRSEG